MSNDEMITLLALLSGDIGDQIIKQESQGQREFTGSETLPRKFGFGKQEDLESFGVVFHKPVDDLFISVTLPAGWKKVATEHNLWSHLVDEKGRERASLFYKAAFYDRDASTSVTPRYTYHIEPECGYGEEYTRRRNDDDLGWVCHIKDAGKTIETFGPLYPTEERNKWQAMNDVEEQGRKWMEENYPDWKNPVAYWTD